MKERQESDLESAPDFPEGSEVKWTLPDLGALAAAKRECGTPIIVPTYNGQNRVVRFEGTYSPALASSQQQFKIAFAIDGTCRIEEVARECVSWSVACVQSTWQDGEREAIVQGFERASFVRVEYVQADGRFSFPDFCHQPAAIDCCDREVVLRWRRECQWISVEWFLQWIASKDFSPIKRAVYELRQGYAQCGARPSNSDILDHALRRSIVINLSAAVYFLYPAQSPGGTTLLIFVALGDRPGTRLQVGCVVSAHSQPSWGKDP